MEIADTLLTIEQYARLPDTGRPTELVRGRVVEMPQPTPRHGYVCNKIGRVAGNFADEHDLGRVMSNDSGVITERGPDTMRGADVCFYSYQRLPKGELPLGYIDVMPELVFEVRSQYDRWVEMLRKAAEYLAAGVSVVCLVDPNRHRVMVCEADDTRILNADDILDFPQILPGFSIRVGQLFE